MADESANREIILARLKYDHELGQVGLKGTLCGACGCLGVIVVVAAIQVITGHNFVDGWFVAMVAVLVLPVTAYGAFIFNRTLSVSATIAGHEGKITTSPANAEDRRSSRESPAQTDGITVRTASQ